MPWVKIDDQFADHPKIIAAGPMASWLFVCGLTYCARLLTDGFIPDGQVRKLADLDNARELADKLVQVGLWEREDGGYRVHDYLDYNPSRDKAISIKAARAEAGSRGGKQRASNLLESCLEDASSKTQPRTRTRTRTQSPEQTSTLDKHSLAPDKPARKRDLLWDQLVIELGHEPATASERGKWNAALAQLRTADATPEEIHSRCLRWPRAYPGARLTPTALASHWGDLSKEPEPKTISNGHRPEAPLPDYMRPLPDPNAGGPPPGARMRPGRERRDWSA